MVPSGGGPQISARDYFSAGVVVFSWEASEGIVPNGQPPITHALDGNLVGRIVR
jgi:hypothetical protein